MLVFILKENCQSTFEITITVKFTVTESKYGKIWEKRDVHGKYDMMIPYSDYQHSKRTFFIRSRNIANKIIEE